MHQSASDVAGWGAVVLGFIAALLWWKASIVKVRSDKYIAQLRARGEIGPSESPFQITEGPYDVMQSIKASSTWNAWAAGCTGLSVLAQAAANLLNHYH
jgi:hypothetical protein